MNAADRHAGGQNDVPLPIRCFRDGLVDLKRGPTVFGSAPYRAGGFEVELRRGQPGTISPQHCGVAPRPGSDEFSVEDLGSATGTFVNGRPIQSHELASGDLLQVGEYAWIFNAADGFLVPVTAIPGVAMELCGAGINQRLQDVSLKISAGAQGKPGEFLAIIGPSGAGKSTLIQAMVGAPGALDRGAVLAGHKNIQQSRAEFQQALGYVSQKEVCHGDLTAPEVVHYSAKLRSKSAGHHAIEAILREVDIPEARWSLPSRKLSGGESKRLRTAAELIGHPRLLLLDEPASGLDPDREIALLRLLQSLSLRGCTVVMVTHNLERLEMFKRVVAIKNGMLCFDGAPGELRGRMPTQEFKSLDCDSISEPLPSSAVAPLPTATTSSDSGGQPQTSDAAVSETRGTAIIARGKQLGILCARELSLLAAAWPKRFFLPVVVVPALFALALGLAVKAPDHHLLGFLAVLSCIWMGASLGLMSIVDEREIFDHERLLFLHIVPYVLAKVVVLWLLGLLQVSIFLVLLTNIREWLVRQDAILYGVFWTALYLELVVFAAVNLGLLISAVAGTRRPVAGFILPLVMMAQIVFSVQVAGEGSAPLHEAYGEFHAHWCEGSDLCGRRAQSWLPDKGWLCDRCRSDPNAARTSDADADRYQNELRPNALAAVISYLTISRYGDMALRSFAYWKTDQVVEMTFGYSAWRSHARNCLILASALLALATCATLFWQSALWPKVRRMLARKLGSLHDLRNRVFASLMLKARPVSDL